MSDYAIRRRERPSLGGKNHRVSPERADATSEALMKKLIGSVDYYVYPREEEVPAGYYFSRIEKIQAREKPGEQGKPGKIMLDVSYDIEGYDYRNRGQTFRIKQSYALGSDHLYAFFKAMDAAGVAYRADYENIVGTTEKICLAYVSKKSDIGSIVARAPYWESDEEEAADDEASADEEWNLPDEESQEDDIFHPAIAYEPDWSECV